MPCRLGDSGFLVCFVGFLIFYFMTDNIIGQTCYRENQANTENRGFLPGGD